MWNTSLAEIVPPSIEGIDFSQYKFVWCEFEKRALFDELAGDKHILLTEYIVGCFERAVVIFFQSVHNNKMLHPQLIRQKWGLSAAC